RTNAADYDQGGGDIGPRRDRHSLTSAEPRDAVRIPDGTEARMTAVAMAAPRAEVRASSIFVALLRRDMRVARRELPFFLLRTTLQPLMFVVVFGYLLPRMGFMGRGYTTALLPGVLAISLTFSSIQSVALPM